MAIQPCFTCLLNIASDVSALTTSASSTASLTGQIASNPKCPFNAFCDTFS